MNKLEAVKLCIAKDSDFNKRLNSRTITVDQFIKVISKDSYNLSELGLSAAGTAKLLKRVFPLRTNNIKACTYLLFSNQLKYCNNCKIVHSIDNYYKSSDRPLGVQDFCKSCMDLYTHPSGAERAAKRRANKLNATPKWADLQRIKEIYDNCPEGYHVDHIIPLQGYNVCGLHVETNLQYLTEKENLSKGNKLL